MTENISDAAAPTTAIKSAPVSLGDDLLRGAGAIAQFLFGDRRQRRKVYYLTGEATVRMPHFRLGAIICARKSTLLRWIEDHERQGAGSSDA
jgi:hypothetical protein